MYVKPRFCIVPFLLVACASAHGTASTATTPATAAAQRAQVPSDAMDLIPADSQLVASLNVAELSHAKSFGLWRGWAERYACASSDDLRWLTTQTTRALFAGRSLPKPELPKQFLVVLQGKYTSADVDHVLALLAARLGVGPAAPRSQQLHGRFAVSRLGDASASLLEDRLLLVGHSALVDAALDRIRVDKPARWVDGSATRSLADQLGCAQQSLCAQLLPSSAGSNLLEQQLSALGMHSLGRSLGRAPSVLVLDAKAGLHLGLAAQLASPDEAAGVVKQVNDWLWQIGVFAHLAGFPDVLDAAKVRANGTLVQLDFPITQPDLEQLEQRVASMLQNSEPPECQPQLATQSAGKQP